MRSLRHLAWLFTASGLVCAAVLITNAPRLWYLAGPAALAVLDAVASSRVGRRARHTARLRGLGLPRELAREFGRVVLVAPLLVVAISVAVLAGGSLVALVGTGVLALSVAVGAGAALLIALLASLRRGAYRRLRPPALLEAELRAAQVAVAQAAFAGTLAGQDEPPDAPHTAYAPEAVRATLEGLMASAGRLTILAVVLPRDADAPAFDASLADARDTLMGEFSLLFGGSPSLLIVLPVGARRRLVITDPTAADLVLTHVQRGAPRDVAIASAVYPDDAETALALIEIAFRRIPISPSARRGAPREHGGE